MYRGAEAQKSVSMHKGGVWGGTVSGEARILLAPKNVIVTNTQPINKAVSEIWPDENLTKLALSVVEEYIV